MQLYQMLMESQLTKSVGHGVSGLQGGKETFETAQRPEGLEGLVIRDARVFGASQVAKPSMLWTDGGVVEAG